MNDLKEKILQGTSKSLRTIGIDKLKEIIRVSDKERREHALLFCSDKDIPPFGDISHSDLCAGTECRVILKDCINAKAAKAVEKQIGTFHTHVNHHINKEKDKFLGNLSKEDIYSSISNRRRFSCLGLTEKQKPIIKCFIPEFDIDPTITMKSFIAQDNYYKKLTEYLTEYNISEYKPDGTKKSLDELLKELPQDKRTVLSNTYDRYIKADDELYKESESLSKKLLHKDADIIIR